MAREEHFDAWIIGTHDLPDDRPHGLTPAAEGWVLFYDYQTEEWDVLDPHEFYAEYEFV